MTKIEVGKTYQMRDGRSVRIIATDAKGDWPIVALFQADANREYTIMLDANGVYHGNHNYDLIIPPKRESRWANLYANPISGFATREEADECASPDRTRVLEIITEDGKLVDVKIHEVKK